MRCASCQEREARARYLRLNRRTQEVERLCQDCWLELRRADRDEWRYFRGVGRLFLLFTVAPIVAVLLLGAVFVAFVGVVWWWLR